MSYSMCWWTANWLVSQKILLWQLPIEVITITITLPNGMLRKIILELIAKFIPCYIHTVSNLAIITSRTIWICLKSQCSVRMCNPKVLSLPLILISNSGGINTRSSHTLPTLLDNLDSFLYGLIQKLLTDSTNLHWWNWVTFLQIVPSTESKIYDFGIS